MSPSVLFVTILLAVICAILLYGIFVTAMEFFLRRKVETLARKLTAALTTKVDMLAPLRAGQGEGYIEKDKKRLILSVNLTKRGLSHFKIPALVQSMPIKVSGTLAEFRDEYSKVVTQLRGECLNFYATDCKTELSNGCASIILTGNKLS